MNQSRTLLNLLKTFALAFGFIAIGACEKMQPPVTENIDLELQINAPISVVQIGKTLALNIALKNLGAKAATGVNVTYQIPQNAIVVSSNPNKGLCQTIVKTLNCAFDTLEANAAADISVSLNPTAIGVMTNTASVSAFEVDPIASNNSSSVTTTIQAAPVPTGTINLPPTGKVAWDWQIGASGDSNVTVPSGVSLLDLDGFNISASKIASLKAQGIYTVCYIDAGSLESDRPDSALFPEYLKLQKDPDWPEWFLDPRDVFKPNSVYAKLLTARFQMCKDKGFDALEPDNLQNDENVKAVKISKQEQIDFNGWLADTAHSLGLAVFQKNGPDNILLKDRTGKMMVEKFDGILNEQCQEFGECSPLAEFGNRNKLALNVEYKKALTLDCALSDTLKINSLKKDLALTGGNMSGYIRQTCP